MFSYDFHIHSALSPCGSMDMTPGNIVNMAKLLEIDAIAVTDHNTIGNAEAVMKAGKSIGVSGSRLYTKFETSLARSIFGYRVST